ncbi:MAG: hypothetical protein HY961_04645, partial [Ignavibacteriae bacterium]|nr:hypothetical protein [Ignavibacteriota bacterium]
MSNIIKETATKVAGNVTQSVTSAVIVFLITTYVLVDIKKKDDDKAATDTIAVQKEAALPTTAKGGTSRRTAMGAQQQSSRAPLDQKDQKPTSPATNETPILRAAIPDKSVQQQAQQAH